MAHWGEDLALAAKRTRVNLGAPCLPGRRPAA